jgi:hypothetical protein
MSLRISNPCINKNFSKMLSCNFHRYKLCNIRQEQAETFSNLCHHLILVGLPPYTDLQS